MRLTRRHPIITELIRLIKEEGRTSEYLTLSCKELYNIYKPLQAYNLDLTTSQTSDSRRLNNFGTKLRSSLFIEFEQATEDLPVKNLVKALPTLSAALKFPPHPPFSYTTVS